MSDGVWNTCYKCKSRMWIPQALEEAARAARNKIEFFCAYGHGQVYVEGESERAKLRRERDVLAQRIAQRDDEIKRLHDDRIAAERRLSAAKGQVTKLKKRASHGVCPCCNRTFSQLQKHMQSKHPEFIADNVVPIKGDAA